MKINSIVAKSALVLALALTSTLSLAGDKAISFGAFAGLHGGSITHFKDTSITDPVKGGLIGVNYGYHVGADINFGPIWSRFMYEAGNVWVTDYTGGTTPAPEARFANQTLTLPLMFTIKRAGAAKGAVGAYYAHPLTDASIRDSGMAFAFQAPLSGTKAVMDVLVLGSFRETVQKGYPLQVALSLGMNF